MLSDPMQRMVYDEIHGYAATAINPFLDDSPPKDHTFVDEFCCIGIRCFHFYIKLYLGSERNFFVLLS